MALRGDFDSTDRVADTLPGAETLRERVQELKDDLREAIARSRIEFDRVLTKVERLHEAGDPQVQALEARERVAKQKIEQAIYEEATARGIEDTEEFVASIMADPSMGGITFRPETHQVLGAGYAVHLFLERSRSKPHPHSA